MDIEISGRAVRLYTGGRAFDPSLPPVVLIHGAGHDHSVWNLQCRYLAHHGHSAVAPDLPGHGRSAGPPLASIEALAAWIVELLDALKIETAVLVGHSMGSLIALQAAAESPQRISALVLAGSVAPMPVAEPLLEAAANRREKAHAMINQWSYAPRSGIGRSAQPGTCLTIANLRLMEHQEEGVLHTDLTACNRYATGIEAASRVRCPTLLIGAARDQMTPPKASAPLLEALAQVPGGARRVVLPECGHAMMAEAPDGVTDALARFLDEQKSLTEPPLMAG